MLHTPCRSSYCTAEIRSAVVHIVFLVCHFVVHPTACVGTDVNATDARGVTPLHLALSRLRMLGEGKGKGKEGGRERVMGVGVGEGDDKRGAEPGGMSSFRKKEIMQVSLENDSKFLPFH